MPTLPLLMLSKEAKVSPKLIYLYFGNLDTLIETFIKQSDFGTWQTKLFLEDILKDLDNVTKNDVTKLLLSQYVNYAEVNFSRKLFIGNLVKVFLY